MVKNVDIADYKKNLAQKLYNIILYNIAVKKI